MPRETAYKPRLIYPSISTSLSLADLSALAELLFFRIIPQADDQGRLSGSPKWLKAKACPLRGEITTENIPQLLDELVKARLIIQYSASTEPLIQIQNWWDYQGGMKRAYPSKYSAPQGWEDTVKGRVGIEDTSVYKQVTNTSKQDISTGKHDTKSYGETSGSKEPVLEQEPVQEPVQEQELELELEESLVKRRKQVSPDPQVKQILDTISEKAGYQIANYAKEGTAAKRALKMGFTPEQFISCWEKMKALEFWKGKWLSFAKVTENLGEFVAGRLEKPGKTGGKGRDLPTKYTESPDYDD